MASVGAGGDVVVVEGSVPVVDDGGQWSRFLASGPKSGILIDWHTRLSASSVNGPDDRSMAWATRPLS